MSEFDSTSQQQQPQAAGSFPAAEAAAPGTTPAEAQGATVDGQRAAAPDTPLSQEGSATAADPATPGVASVTPETPQAHDGAGATEADASIAREAGTAQAGATLPGTTEDEDIDGLRARAVERDQYLALAQRTQADFENFRKRAARDTAQAMEKGAGRLASELLPALDHLELALKAAGAEGGELFKGVRMVQDELLAAFKRAGIEAFSPTGERFDPNLHEAMVQRPAEGAEPGSVVEVYQQGYRINGTVLRPARVVVAA